MYGCFKLSPYTFNFNYDWCNYTRFKETYILSGKYFIAQQKDIGAVNGYIEEMMEGQKVVKVFCHEEKSMEEFNKLNDHLFESANNANKICQCYGTF